MCTGAILLYKIPRVVIGENVNFMGGEDLLRSRGVEVVVLDDGRCKELMGRYIREKPEVSPSRWKPSALDIVLKRWTGLVRGYRGSES